MIDGQVVGRVLRGEPSRDLDRADGAVDSVVLRLILDDPKHPDFELALWLHDNAGVRAAPSPAEAIAEAKSWLARTEATLRRPRPAAIAETDPAEDEDQETHEPALIIPQPGPRASKPSPDDHDPDLPF